MLRGVDRRLTSYRKSLKRVLDGALALASLALPLIAHAESDTQVAAQAKSAWGLLSEVSMSAGLFAEEGQERSSDLSFTIYPSYRWENGTSTTVDLGFTQNLSGLREFTANDSRVTVSYPGIKLNPFMRLSGAATTYLPFSKRSWQQDGLYTGVTLEPRLIIDFERLGARGLTLQNRLSGTRNFHRYDTATTGESKKKYGLSDRVILNYSPLDPLSLTAIFTAARGWSYHGNTIDSFRMDQEVSYSLTEKLNLALGHTNLGSMLKANGQDSNIAFVNELASVVYFSLGYQL